MRPYTLDLKISKTLDIFADLWVYGNNLNQKLILPIKIHLNCSDELSREHWYLVLANHQSWVDIVIMQRILTGKIPALKFFLKKSLIYVPLLGLAWWALGFPFVNKNKSTQSKKKNLQTATHACKRYQYMPSTLVNFAEGTRFNQKKHDHQYKHLMCPKAGGSALVFNQLGTKINAILDITIHYPEGHASFLHLLSGQLKHVMVDIQVIPMDKVLIGDYTQPFFKTFMNRWIAEIWRKKDLKMEQLDQHFKELSHV